MKESRQKKKFTYTTYTHTHTTAMPHQRRKSGHGLNQDSRRTVTASDSKHVRPSMPRRYTPSTIHRHTKNTRDRHESSDEESFPQFWYVALLPSPTLLERSD